MEVVFSLKDNLRPLDFITKVSLRDFRLAPVEGPQVAFTVSPLMVVPSPTDDASLEVAMGPISHLSVV